ncbi:MAG TPA: D-alanine--D-alanine ligase [Rudaea sp.]|uniref:D-alanine--D-alanine ligase n=1 Tax=Rudaea sp. TaxID=2136325 RepID=UPI002F93A8FD
MRIADARQFGRVAVAMGGSSAEREVSLDSGRNVLAALRARGVDAHPIDGIPALLDALRAGHFARVFNILHGRGGEDGVLQGALDSLRVPYTGSRVLGSALSMDKEKTKRVWQSLRLPTPMFGVLNARDGARERTAEFAEATIRKIIETIPLPLIVKPVHEGSSVGITRVRSQGDFAEAFALAARYDGELLVEKLIEGDEYTVGILQGQALPSIRIVPAGEFYDYHAKYVADDTKYICPGLNEAGETAIRQLSLTAFESIGCSGWGRVDLMRNAAGEFFLLEVNTTPGMTSHSLVPKAARAVGIEFEELCWRILETSLERDVAQPSALGPQPSDAERQP